MAKISLELIIESDVNYGLSSHIDLPVAVHIHKRLEQFVYSSTHKDPATLIAYIENKAFKSNTNLKIVDKTYTVPENSSRLLSTQNVRLVNAKSVSMGYGEIDITNVSAIDNNGREAPLFWKHILPEGTTSVTLKKVENGIETKLDTGFVVDLAANALYTNYSNVYDESTQRTTAYYVYPEYDGFTAPVSDDDRFTAPVSDDDRIVTGSGLQMGRSRQMLSLVPVANEATWEDIDLETGKLSDSKVLYTKSSSSSGYNYSFNKGDRWWVKPSSNGMISTLGPLLNESDYSWFLQFTNGDIKALVNGKVRRYYLPEFTYQNFTPAKPIKYSGFDRLSIATKNLLFSTRKNLKIDPSAGLHLTVSIYDESDVLLKILTTNTSLHGTRYQNDVFYESDLIDSWDNVSGCIALGLDIFPNYKVTASYFYKANSLEYKLVNVNPLLNSKIKDKLVVFYCVPDVAEQDRAIHHLLVDSTGYITYCSQGTGLGHLNLQIKNIDQTINSESVIGMKYFSEVDANNFTSLYTAGYENDNGYMVLAEVCIGDFSLEENQEVIDIRELGGKVKDDYLEEAIKANPKIQNSYLCNAPFGLQIPEENVMVIEAPYSLLEDYGGVLSEAQAESLLRTLMPVTGFMAIEWTYPKVDITGYYDGTNIVLNIPFEGVYDYKLYRQVGSNDRELIHTFSPVSRTTLSYTDSNITSTGAYTYSLSLVENSVEYPETKIKIKVN